MSDIFPVAVPKWGIEMVEGTINSWKKQEGDSVSKGDDILEIESDKIVNVWEAPADGILRRQLVEAGDVRNVGQLLGIIAGADVSDASIDAFISAYSTDAGEETETPAAVEPPAKTARADLGKRTNPVVRRLAEDMGVDLESIVGTGRNGRISQDDVRAAAAGVGGADTSGESDSDEFEVIPFSSTRKTIAQRLTQAKQEIPHYYLSVEWEVGNLLACRARLNAGAGQKISLNDLIVCCTARALMKVPEVNINVIDNSIHQYKHANIALAIATEKGLYPATLHHAETLSPAEVATATADLADRAKSASLTRKDLSDASFTLSNLGMLGIDQFTAIINPPMGAILALGAAREKAVVRDGGVTVATLISATLSCDHRAIDGALGARFLAALKDELAALE
jgi:pyruvate dehydrogenase E2 component (dihydrolipoamide acetyltransferase)